MGVCTDDCREKEKTQEAEILSFAFMGEAACFKTGTRQGTLALEWRAFAFELWLDWMNAA